MGKRRRIYYSGEIYHVMHRGVQRRVLFRDEEDFRKFEYALEYGLKKYDVRLHAYCLMSNHVHLLVEMGEDSLSKFIASVYHRYSVYHNRKYELSGHLYEGPCRVIRVNSDAYFLAVNRYIQMNPVNAHVVDEPEDYRWSSFREIIGKVEKRLVDTSRTFAYFNGPMGIARYVNFVTDRQRIYKDEDNDIRMSMFEDDEGNPL